MRCHTITLASLVLITVAVTGPTHAQLTLLSQTRSVSADASICLDGPVDSSLVSSVVAGTFDESVAETMDGFESTAGGGLCIEMVEEFNSAATQDTTISAAGILGNGTANANKANGAIEDGFANGDSSLSVTFEVTAPMSYELFGEVAGEQVIATGGYFPSEANVSLLQGSSVIHSVDALAPDPSFGGGSENPFAFSGVLSPGTYTLNASAAAMASGGLEASDQASFSFTFVPEPTTPALMVLGLLLSCGFVRKRSARHN